MKREDGYLVLDDFKMKRVKENVYRFSEDRNEWYFKEIEIERQYKELFYSILLNNQKYDSVKYDLAKYKKYYGIISKSYNPNHLKRKTIADVNKQYGKLGDSNIEAMNNNLIQLCKEEGYTYTKKVREALLLKFIMQILLGYQDLHTKNIEVLLDKSIKLSPFYDLESCGMVKLESQFSYYILEYMSYQKYTNGTETIKNFLNYASKKDLEVFKESLELIRHTKTRRIITEIEDTTSKKISHNIKLGLVRNFKQNLKKVKQIVNKNKKN